MTTCPYCKYDFTIESMSNTDREFCSVSCRVLYRNYEKKINILHQRLIDFKNGRCTETIFVKWTSRNRRKYLKPDNKLIQTDLILI